MTAHGQSSSGPAAEKDRTEMGTLILPGIAAEFSFGNAENPLVFISGGRPPSLLWMKEFFPGKELWCIDSGLVPCLEAGFLPSRLIGDGDSTPPGLWEKAVREGVRAERFPRDKDLTDLQLAFLTAGKEQPLRRAVVTGCWGGRFDHLWSGIYSAFWAKEEGLRILAFADGRETLFLLSGEEEMELKINDREGKNLSLLPLGGDCSGVTISGVQWELGDAELLQRRPFAVSNMIMENKTPRISLKKGTLGVYCG